MTSALSHELRSSMTSPCFNAAARMRAAGYAAGGQVARLDLTSPWFGVVQTCVLKSYLRAARVNSPRARRCSRGHLPLALSADLGGNAAMQLTSVVPSAGLE